LRGPGSKETAAGKWEGALQLQLDNLRVGGIKAMLPRMTISGYFLSIEMEVGPGRNVTFSTPMGEPEASMWKFEGAWTVPGGHTRFLQKHHSGSGVPVFLGSGGSVFSGARSFCSRHIPPPPHPPPPEEALKHRR